MTDEPAADDLQVKATDALVRVPALVQRTFTQLKIQDSRIYPESVVIEAERQIVEDAKFMRLAISAYVLADSVAKDSYTKTVDFPYPQSPWQFFKERHKDSWFLRRYVARFPVVYRKHPLTATVYVDRYLAYPKAEVIAGIGAPVAVEVVRIESNDPAAEREGSR